MEQVGKEGKAQYKIVVKTATGYNGVGGKDNLVLLEMTGKNGTVTGAIQLNKIGDPTFRRGETDVFNIEALDVGLPVLVRLELREHKAKNPWGVRKINIFYNGQKVKFPIHDWVEKELSVSAAEGLLHHKIGNPYILSTMKREVECAKVLLPWVRRPGPTDSTRSLPRYVDAEETSELPLIFRPTETWTQTFSQNSVAVGVMKAKAFLQKHQAQLTSLESYHMLYKVFEPGTEKSEFLARWQSDEEFGREHLCGTCPLNIQRCVKVPDSIQITSDHVKELLDGNSFDEEMKAGKVYMTDYTTCFQGVNRNKNTQGEQLYCPDAFCLFHVNSKDDLVPIGIQLVPGDADTIFTPKDSEYDWLLAKMYCKVAFSNSHAWYYHFMMAHGVIESFAVALFRNLPRCHPVYKLLRQHVQTVSVINLIARKALIMAGSMANKAFAIEGEDYTRTAYKTFDMEDLNFPDFMKKRGLDDEKLLPKYYYRDDASKLWSIIKDFVSSVIRYYYTDDQDIIRDKFLQDMMDDLATEGIGWDDEQNRKGLPYPLKTVDQLIQLSTTVIFTSSVQHSAMNSPQYEGYKFVPSNPSAMRLPPHKKGEGTMERIMQSLPDVTMSLITIATTFALAMYSPDEVYLGDYPMKLFTEKEPKRAMAKFKRDLETYGQHVTKRNGDERYPYDWLLPENIASAISI